MILDPNRIYDGYTNLVAGVDDGREPNLIDKTQVVSANNAVFRNGAPATRPPILTLDFTFENPDLWYDEDGVFVSGVGGSGQSETVFRTGLFQEGTYYSPRKGENYLMASISGRLYQITIGNGQTASVREIPLDRANRGTIPIAYHLQADIYFIVQDGEATPIIFDGVSARRAGPDEIFTGKMMGYGLGRIVLVDTAGRVNFGNLYDSEGNAGADVLKFTEASFLNEGFPSAIPAFMGAPTAVQFLPLQDTATGVGECLVFGERGVESFFLSIPREQWKDSPFQRTALLANGAVGHRCVTMVNQDIWFRSHDGWRSYRQARAEQDKWAQLPESTNVSEWVELDNLSNLLSYASSICFQNRLLGTCTPYPNQGNLYHNGALQLDFTILSTFGKQTDPAWDGHIGNYNGSAETGLKITRLVEGVFGGYHRAFMFGLDSLGENILREFSSILEGEDSDGPVTASFITRAMDFDMEMNEKLLYGGDLWVKDATQSTTVTVNYRPDHVPDFSPWHSFSVDPITGVLEDGEIDKPGFKPRASLPKPADTDDETTSRIMRRFYEMQAQIIWTGRARIRKLRVQAKRIREDSKAQVE